MRRATVVVVLFSLLLIILGAVANLVVAHGLYLFAYRRECRILDPLEAKRLFLTRSMAEGEFRGLVAAGCGWTIWEYTVENSLPGQPSYRTMNHAQIGFPFRAFEGDGWLLDPYSEATNAWQNLPHTSANRVEAILQIFTWHPRWLAFVVNTLIYTVLIAVPLLGPRWVRRWLVAWWTSPGMKVDRRAIGAETLGHTGRPDHDAEDTRGRRHPTP